MRAAIGLCGLLIAGCGNLPPVGSLDGGPMPLVCTTPMSIPLVAATMGPNPGIPLAGVGWSGGTCRLTTDQSAPDLVLTVADLHGSILGENTAQGAGHWRIQSSSTGSGPTSYIANFPRDTDITLVLATDTDMVTIVFRLEGPGPDSTLVLVSMHR